MKPKTIVILSVLLAACAAYIGISKWLRQGPSEVAAPAASKPLFKPEIKDAAQLTLAPADAPKMVFVKADGQWKLTQPVAARANEHRVSDVLRVVESLQTLRDFVPGKDDQADDATTGLDHPSYVVTIADASGKTHALRIGKAVPFASPAQTYVRPEGDAKTYVTQADLGQVLFVNPREYRDRTVLTIPTDNIVRLAVIGEQSFDLQKTAGQWTITKPVAAPADSAKVASMVRNLASVSTERFVSDNPTDLAMYDLEPGKERLVVRAWTQAPPPATTTNSPASASATATASAPAMKEWALALGKSQDDTKVYAKVLNEPAVFLLDASLLADFQPKLADLRDKKILKFSPTDVIAIDIQLPTGSCKLARVFGKWKMVQPVAGPANDAAVTRLLGAMAGLQADNFPQPQQALSLYGLDNPKSKITLEFKDKSQPQGIALGAASKTGEFTFVAPAGSTVVAVVKSLDAQPPLADPTSYYDPQLGLPWFDKAGVQEIDVARKDGKFVVHRSQGKWALTAPDRADADADTVENILRQLASLTANRIVSLGQAVPDKYAKAADALTVSAKVGMPATRPAATASAPATAPTDAAVFTLHVVKSDNNSYAWVEGLANNPVGEFPASLYETLAGELRSRVVWTFTPDEITAVRIVTPKETVELKKDADKWTLQADPYVKIDAQQVKSYLAQLQGLLAERFVSTRNEDPEKAGLKEPALTVELSAGDKKLTLTIGKGQDKATSRPAASSGVQGVFELSSATAEGLVKTWKDFQEVASPPAPPNGAAPRPGLPPGIQLPED